MIISYLINVFLIVQTFPKMKKFNNNKATFPLFDALGELYDGKFPNIIKLTGFSTKHHNPYGYNVCR
jgi:hypothetical protein